MTQLQSVLIDYIQSETKKYLGRNPALIDDIGVFQDPQWRVCARVGSSGVMYALSSRFNAGRLVQRLPTIHAFMSLLMEQSKLGEYTISIGDRPSFTEPCISFSSSKPYDYLIPDPYFCRTGAYAEEKTTIENAWKDLADREPVLFWRGGLTGDVTREDGRFQVVYRLNELASKSIDVKLACDVDALANLVSSCAAVPNATSRSTFTRPELECLTAERVPFIEFINYQFQLDLDGNSNAWDSMFKKMLLGSAIFKIGHAFKQWYYDELIEKRLTIWRHSAADIGNEFLRHADDLAFIEDFGGRAKAFAERMTVLGELQERAERFPKQMTEILQFPYYLKEHIFDAKPIDSRILFQSVKDIRSLSDNLYRNGFRAAARDVFALTPDCFPLDQNSMEAHQLHLQRLIQRAEQHSRIDWQDQSQ